MPGGGCFSNVNEMYEIGKTFWCSLGLRARLLVLLTPVLVLAGVAQHVFQLRYEVAEYRTDMAREAGNLMEMMAGGLIGSPANAGKIEEYSRNPLIGHIEWRDRSGVRVEAHGSAPEALAPAWFRHFFTIHPLVQVRALEAYGGMHYGEIQVRFSGALLENRLWREARSQLWQLGISLMLLMLVLFVFLARWLRPLGIINAAGRRFMDGDYSVRVVSSPGYVPEIRAMAEMLNQSVAQVGGLLLSLSEQRRAVDNAVIVVESDTSGVIIYVNDKFCEVSGYSRDEVIGHDHRFLNAGTHSSTFFDDLWSTLRRGETWQGEICNRGKSGDLFWLLTTITPVIGPDGAISRFISVRVDITQSKLAKQALLKSEDRFRGTFEQAAVGMAHVAPDGRFMQVNRKLCDIVGYSQEELMARTFQDITHADDLEADLDMAHHLLAGEIQSYQMEKRYIHKNGTLVWINLTGSLIRESSGEPRNFIAVIEDISGRKLAEGVMSQQAEIIHQIHDAVFSTDLDGTLVSWNKGARQLFGYSHEEAVGQPVRFIAPAGAEADFYSTVFLVLMRAGRGTLEIPLQKKSGKIFTAHFSLTLLRDAAGQEIGVACYVFDITARKAAENALRASENRYRTLVESIHDWVWEVNEHGAYTYSSPRVREMLGYEPHEVLGKTPFDLMVPEEAERVGAAFSEIAASRSPIHMLENINLHRDGTPVVMETSGTPIFDEQGVFRGYQGIDRDVTERKRFENAVRESQARLARAQQMARLGNWDWDVVNDRILCSDELYRIFDVSPDVVFTRERFLRYVHPDDRELVEKNMIAALAGEVSYSVDFRILTGGGVELTLHSEGEVEFNADGKGVRMFGLVQDITERKQIEQEIRDSREQLRELSNHLQIVREEEKASIAREIHDELGGNLTALKMDIYWLLRKLPTELDLARDKVESMSGVVDTSVHAIRRIVTELRPTVLDDLGLLAAMQWQASEFSKRYNIQCKVAMHGEEVDLTDEIRIALFRIYQEALTNVARYSRASLVQVDVWREHDKIALEVFDNGIGIPEGAIMQPTSHGLRGMMERARSLGGSVEIGSAPGEGVAISVRIPLAMAGAAA